MRHHVAVAKLGRTSAHRRAMLRNMVTSLFQHERITTTVPKAKEARRWADRMITFAKRGDLHARRRAARFVNNETVLKKLFEEIAPSLAERPGGYTRVVRVGVRKGDVAEKAILELVTKSPAREKPKNRKSAERLKEFKVRASASKPKGKKKAAEAQEAEEPTETEPAPATEDSGEARET